MGAMAAPTGGGGLPRNPLPRKKIPANLPALARGHSERCIKVLAGICSQEAVPAAARVSAAIALLDRGWGKPPQAHAGEDGKGQIEVVIRHFAEGMPDEHLVTDATPVKIEADEP